MEIVGIIFINFRRPYSFTKNDKKFIQQFAKVVSVTIKNRRLLQSLIDNNSITTPLGGWVFDKYLQAVIHPKSGYIDASEFENSLLEATIKLNGMLIHRLSNDIGAGMAIIRTIKKEFTDKKLTPYLDKIEESMASAVNFCKSILYRIPEKNIDKKGLAITRIKQDPEFIYIHHLLSKIYQNMLSDVPNDILFKEEIKETFLPVSAHREDLIAIFLNLINNAMNSMPDGGVLTIGCAQMADDIFNSYIKIWVVDTGRGIDANDIKNIFRRNYFTENSKGLCVGLHLSIKYIEELGGTIIPKSEIDQGTRIEIVLPGYYGSNKK